MYKLREFHKLTSDDIELMAERISSERLEICDLTSMSLLAWAEAYDTYIADKNGCLLALYEDEAGMHISYPFGDGDKKKTIELMIKYAEEHSAKLIIGPISFAQRRELMSMFPKTFRMEPLTDYFDYVYNRVDLETLQGRKYAGKRNHIRHFENGSDWRYERISEDNKRECLKLEEDWLASKTEKLKAEYPDLSGQELCKKTEVLKREYTAIKTVFDNYEKLPMMGGLLRREGKVAAFALGEELNDDTVVVHFEKADPAVDGAFPMINREFVKNECAGYTYVNREDDANDLMLRKAKRSYYPCFMARKYNAVLSDIVFAEEDDFCEVKKIWRESFDDPDEYIDMFLKELNGENEIGQKWTEEKILLLKKGGRVVSIGCFLNGAYVSEGRETPVKYVYALATAPEFRGRGYIRELLWEASEIYGVPFVLQPGDSRLQAYYERLGYEDAFEGAAWELVTCAEEEEARTEYEELSDDDAAAHTYNVRREEFLSDLPHVKWEDDYIRYAIKENRSSGGRTLLIGDDILMYRPEGRGIRIVETTLPREGLYGILKAVTGLPGELFLYYDNRGGMSYGMESVTGKGYLNLTLD